MSDKMMNKQLTTLDQKQASLLEIRMDSKRFPRLQSYSREQAVFHMSKIVSQAFLYRGQAADANNIHFIAGSLVDELLDDQDDLGTRQLTFAEIFRVVKRAVLHEEMYGVSVATLYKVIINYVKGEGHRISMEADRKRREENMISLKNSIISPMLQTYANEMARNSKIK